MTLTYEEFKTIEKAFMYFEGKAFMILKDEVQDAIVDAELAMMNCLKRSREEVTEQCADITTE